jgi:hypothetical protein
MCSEAPLHLGYVAEFSAQGTDLVVFPLASEVCGGCDDGAHIVPCFTVDVCRVFNSFNSLNALGWSSSSEYNDCGSEFRVSGLFQNRPVLLRVLTDPPSSAPPYMSVDGETGEARPKNLRNL